MIPTGLSSADHQTYLDALTDPGAEVKMRTTVKVYDRNEAQVAEVVGLVDGQVAVDADAVPTHTLQATIADPDGDLPFDLALTHALSPKSFVGIEAGCFVRDLDRWVDVPIFFGPVVGYSRSGAEVQIDAVGKEHLAIEPHLLGTSLSIHEHRGVGDAIRDIMRARGERRFAFESHSDRVGERLTPGELAVPWEEAQALASDIGRQLFYDGAGYLRLRTEPEQVVYHFGWPASKVEAGFDPSEVRNIIRVKWDGGAATIRPEPAHPLSPESLGRNGEPRGMWEVLDLNTKSRSKAEARGKRELRKALAIAEEVAFDHPPVWGIEPLDLCSVDDPDRGTVVFRLRRFTLPLRPAAMVVGATERIRYPVDRFRVKRKKKRKRRRRRR